MSAILLSGEAAAWPKQPKTPSPAAEVPSLQANRDWEIDRALMLERSERRAWAAAAAGLAIGLIGIAAVFVQGPLRKVVEIPIVVDRVRHTQCEGHHAGRPQPHPAQGHSLHLRTQNPGH